VKEEAAGEAGRLLLAEVALILVYREKSSRLVKNILADGPRKNMRRF
jgi:hypothetical protein